jgi:ACS family glucarate transporter-like MFS transporter
MTSQNSSHVRWFLISWLFVLSAVAFLDRVNISIAGLFIAAEYHLTKVQLGWVLSAFLLGYALFQTPGGWLADKLGPRRVLFIGVLWWGAFTALTTSVSAKLAGALFVFAVIRFLLGAGEAVMYPASNRFVSQWIPTGERGLANGIIFAGVGFGSGVTPGLVTYIVAQYGWRASFWMSAVVGLIVGTAWYLFARDTPEEHASVSPAELNLIQKGRTLSQKSGQSSQNKNLLTWNTILSSTNVWCVTLSYFCFGYVAWIFFSWFYIYLATVRGLDLKSTAFYSTLPPVAMAICSFAGGAISDALTKQYGKRRGRGGIAIFALALTAAFLILGSQAQSVRIASLVLTGGAGALYVAQSSFWSVSADISAGSSGSVSGFMNMGAQFGGAVTTVLTPWIAEHYGWTLPFVVAAVLASLGALAWFFVDPERKLVLEGAKQMSPLETNT